MHLPFKSSPPKFVNRVKKFKLEYIFRKFPNLKSKTFGVLVTSECFRNMYVAYGRDCMHRVNACIFSLDLMSWQLDFGWWHDCWWMNCPMMTIKVTSNSFDIHPLCLLLSHSEFIRKIVWFARDVRNQISTNLKFKRNV